MKPRILAAIAAFALIAVSPAMALTPKERGAALDRIADLIQKNYVFKDKASAIAAELRGWKSDPEIAALTDEKQLAFILTERLRKQDRHFSVMWKAGAQKGGVLPTAAEGAQFERSHNYGFDKVERLPGNVCAVRLNFFADFDVALTGDKTPAARKAGEAALAFVQNCDAVIFDLRRNGGGSPAMIDLLLSGFFGDKPVLLNRFFKREGDKTEEYTTLANFTGARRPSVPLYVLTSDRTASAAEEFSYDVQTQKRGLLVGETTYGGANPGDEFDAGAGFAVFVSTGTAINAITGKNWEGVGVVPDIAVPAAVALPRAYAEALKEILKSATPGAGKTEAERTLEQLQAQAAPPAIAPLSDFVGVYGGRKVVLKDNALFYGRTPTQKLVPIAADTFGIDEAPQIRLSFHRSKAGRVDSLTASDGGGGTMVFPRGAE
jgi:retinol-binding protein 3